jgi:hypothetical protein
MRKKRRAEGYLSCCSAATQVDIYVSTLVGRNSPSSRFPKNSVPAEMVSAQRFCGMNGRDVDPLSPERGSDS